MGQSREDLTMIVPVGLLGLLLVNSCLSGKPRNRGDRTKVDYEDEDYYNYNYYYYSDDYDASLNEIVPEDNIEKIVELTDRYVAPQENSAMDLTEDRISESDSGFLLERFDIFPDLRPPPREGVTRNDPGESKLQLEKEQQSENQQEQSEKKQIVQKEQEKEQQELNQEEGQSEASSVMCPGESLRDCIELACVPLTQLWVYSA